MQSLIYEAQFGGARNYQSHHQGYGQPQSTRCSKLQCGFPLPNNIDCAELHEDNLYSRQYVVPFFCHNTVETYYADCSVLEHVRFGGGSVMVWAGICLDGLTNMSLTGEL